MNQAPNEPLFPEDPQLDTALRTLARFSPRQGFEDRVVTRVRVPLPRWLRGLAASARGLVSGVTGWTILATFSAATVAAWGSALAAGLRYQEVVVGGTSISLDQVRAAMEPALSVLLSRVAAEWAAVQQTIAGAGLSARALLAGYGILALVCALALRRLMAEPARAKGTGNAVR